MRRFSALLLSAALCGCQTSPHNDLLEAELRARDADLRELRSELDRTAAYNDYLNRELKHLQHMGGPATPPVAEGALVSGSRIRAIALGRQTGGFEEDAVPGDEALQVVVEPRDVDNHVVKVPGTVQVYALEVTDQGVKKPLSGWHVDAEELRKSWRSGILSTGYHLVLPWKSWPTTCKLRVVVRFVSEEERLFEADRDLTKIGRASCRERV